MEDYLRTRLLWTPSRPSGACAESVRMYRIIIANPTTPTGIIALLYCRWFRIPFVIQSEGGFQGSGQGLKEKFKKYLMEKADFFLTGMGGDNDYFLRYGAKKDQLKPYPFSSLTKKDLVETRSLLSEEKHLLKQRKIDKSSYLMLETNYIQS